MFATISAKRCQEQPLQQPQEASARIAPRRKEGKREREGGKVREEQNNAHQAVYMEHIHCAALYRLDACSTQRERQIEASSALRMSWRRLDFTMK